jgi:hypothetical protein
MAWFAWREANNARLIAEKARIETDVAQNEALAQRNRADAALQSAQTTKSLFLADLARQQRTAGDAGTATLLALEALPDTGVARPYLPEPELQLDGAWRDLRERLVIDGHTNGVFSAAFSPDGKRIVTASRDKTARLWNAETGKSIGELQGHTDGVFSAAFSPDGNRIVTASWDKTARLWEVFANTQELVSHAKRAMPRCLTAQQRKAFFLPLEPPPWCIELEKWPYHTDVWKEWLRDTRAGKKNPPLPAAE